MVETGVDPGKHSGGSLLDHINLHQEFARLTYQEFARFKSKSQVSSVSLAKFLEPGCKFLSEFFDISFYVSLLIRYLNSTAEIEELKVLEIKCGIEENLRGSQENFDIKNIASGMHMAPVDIHPGILHDPHKMRHLVDGNSEFGIHMTYGNISVATRHAVRIDPDAHRNFRMFGPELLQDGEIVYIDLWPQLGHLFYFFQGNPIRSVNNARGIHPCRKTQLDLLNRHSIKTSSEFIEQFQNREI